MLYADAPTRWHKGVARELILVILLVWLGVDQAWPDWGLEPRRLKEPFFRMLKAGPGHWVRALLVHAQDDQAKAFYLNYNSKPLPR